MAAEILARKGYPSFEWSDRAVCRAADYLYRLAARTGNNLWLPDSNDTWQVWIINKRCGTNYPTTLNIKPGKNMGWTTFTHQ